MRRRRSIGHSLAHQALALRGRYRESEVDLSPGRLRWVAHLQPTPHSRTYKVELVHRPGEIPRVRVLSPTLATRPGEALPHTYDDGSLCLHRHYQWSDAQLLADSIVPWISEWLLFYELWLPTGVWLGGGEWPPRESSDSAQAA